MKLADAAAAYLRDGWEVIALTGKRPNGKLHPRGIYSGISGAPEGPEDTNLLDRYFEHPETTGIGIVLPEHVVVVDIDGEEGAVAWVQLVGDADHLPDGPLARTGRGLHLWYTTWEPINRVAIGPHLDLKGYGGYVAVPPSLHPDTLREYEWIVPLGSTDEPIPEVPAGVVTGVAYLDSRKDTVVRDPVVWRTGTATRREGHLVIVQAPCEPYIEEWRLRRIEGAVPGTRNDELNKMAYGAKLDGVPLPTAIREFAETAIAAGLTAVEVRKTIRSAYRERRG